MIEGIQFASQLQQKLVLERVEVLVKRLQPESVICYGLRTITQDNWSLFPTAQENIVTTAIDLVAVVPGKESDRKALTSKTDVSDKSLDVSTIVHTAESIKSAIKEGNRFFASLLARGTSLYGKKPLLENERGQSVKADAIGTVGTKMALSRAFLDAAVKCAAEARNDAAMFLLHQSVEAVYAAVLGACLGYRSSTHNLNRLARLSQNITPELSKVFPCSTAQERQLFGELNRAYYSARYETPYLVSSDTVSILIERTEAILLLSQGLCAACSSDDVKGTELEALVEVADFDKMVVDVGVDVVLQAGTSNAIRCPIRGKANPLRCKVTDSCLTISVQPGFSEFFPHMKVFVTYKSLRGIHILQSGHLSNVGTLMAERFGLVQSGTGLVKLKVDMNFLDVTVSKSANLELQGRTGKARFLNAGSGHLNAAALQVIEAEVRLTSSGKITACVERELNLRIRKGARSPNMRSMVIS